MFTTRKLFLFVNRAIYILAAAMLMAGLVLTIAQQPALAQGTCGPNQELNKKGECVCVAGYMFTSPDSGDTTAPFCIPQKVTVCHRNNGGVGYTAVDVSINSVTSTEDWWQNGHGQHTIAGGQSASFPEDAWPDFYARNGDFIGAYGDQGLLGNGCAAPQVPTPTPTNTAVPPTSTPTATATSTEVPGNTPTVTATSTSNPGATPTVTSTPGETGGEDPTPVATLSQPSSSVVASTALLIPVTGMDNKTGTGLNKFTFSGLGLLGLGLVMSGIRKRFDI